MADPVKLELHTPQKRFLVTTAEMVVAPGRDGDFGVMIGHTPFVSTLRAGEVRVVNGDQAVRYVVDHGFAEVRPDGITILTDRVMQVEKIDFKEAEEGLVKASHELMAHAEEDPDYPLFQRRHAYAQALAEAARNIKISH